MFHRTRYIIGMKLDTVAISPKVIAERGAKQIAQVSFVERDSSQLPFFINAAGSIIPPVFYL